jgi:RimJ/RimL family protein N-acetyltransferase
MSDADLFHEINSDPDVMAFFPFRRTRSEAGTFLAKLIKQQREQPPTFQAIELKASGECIGFCGLHPANVEPFLPAEAVEIGWRLARRHWGCGYVIEAAEAWLDHGFNTLKYPEILSFAVHENRRSTKVMERLGMRRDPAGDFDHPRVPDSQPDLKRHVLYRLNAEDWRQQKGRPA